MVVAAYNMREEEGIDEANYFLRLREVLKLPLRRGRPEGMPAGNRGESALDRMEQIT